MLSFGSVSSFEIQVSSRERAACEANGMGTHSCPPCALRASGFQALAMAPSPSLPPSHRASRQGYETLVHEVACRSF